MSVGGISRLSTGTWPYGEIGSRSALRTHAFIGSRFESEWGYLTMVYMNKPVWWNGIHGGFKTHCPKRHASSTLVTGTIDLTP